MNVNEIAQQLLTRFSPEERSIPDSANYPGRNAAVKLAMNGALQEVFGKGSPWLRKAERGALLRPPATNVPITVAHGSNLATIALADWEDWYAGCATLISGSDYQNRITNADNDIILKLPYDGASGAVTATIYHTSIELPDDVLELTGPVKFDGCEIQPVDGPGSPTFSGHDFGFVRVTDKHAANAPLTYNLEAWSTEDETTGPRFRLVLSHYPPATRMLEYSAVVVPMVIDSLTSRATLPVPFQWIQSVFYPIALQRLSACPFFLGGSEEIGRGYHEAIKQLAALNPRKNSGIRFVTPY